MIALLHKMTADEVEQVREKFREELEVRCSRLTSEQDEEIHQVLPVIEKLTDVGEWFRVLDSELKKRDL